MNNIELLKLLTSYAKQYRSKSIQSIKRNSHMNNAPDFIEQEAVDAVLVDFINHIASNRFIDYGLYTSDLIAPHQREAV